MKQERNISREVDAYLDGVMSKDEEVSFLEKMQSDLDYNSEVDLQSKVHDMISNDQECIALEDQLESIYDEVYRPMNRVMRLPQISRQTLYRVSGIAASILIVLFASISIFNHSNSSDELYSVYYKPAEMNMSFRAAESVVDRDLRTAMNFYEQRDYQKAISLFEEILQSDNSRIGLNLYSGISQMEIHEYKKANENFQRIIDHKANAFIESAEWYLGLCYLKTNDDDMARNIFSKIVIQDGYYRKEAKKILKKLK